MNKNKIIDQCNCGKNLFLKDVYHAKKYDGTSGSGVIFSPTYFFNAHCKKCKHSKKVKLNLDDERAVLEKEQRISDISGVCLAFFALFLIIGIIIFGIGIFG